MVRRQPQLYDFVIDVRQVLLASGRLGYAIPDDVRAMEEYPVRATSKNQALSSFLKFYGASWEYRNLEPEVDRLVQEKPTQLLLRS